jgi:tRNA (guanine-N7-)-methyltransferase
MGFPPPDRRYERLELVPSDYFRHIELNEWFANENAALELEVDLGCGDGSFLLSMARQFPDRNFLGVERLLGRVRKVCRKADREGLQNVRVLRLESAYTIGWLLPDRCVSRLHLLFPDPWPKKRHHKNRFIKDENVSAIDRVLADEGDFLFKTDHPGYFEWTMDIMQSTRSLKEVAWDAADFYPQTDFERQWEAEGKEIYKLRYKQCRNLNEQTAPLAP